ncbi:MAG: hypothetical protein JSR80_00305 [Verrucomicrobia bacterium]|nr:hypothetical protein [Verrucomicrobiota bacterium]
MSEKIGPRDLSYRIAFSVAAATSCGAVSVIAARLFPKYASRLYSASVPTLLTGGLVGWIATAPRSLPSLERYFSGAFKDKAILAHYSLDEVLAEGDRSERITKILEECPEFAVKSIRLEWLVKEKALIASGSPELQLAVGEHLLRLKKVHPALPFLLTSEDAEGAKQWFLGDRPIWHQEYLDNPRFLDQWIGENAESACAELVIKQWAELCELSHPEKQAINVSAQEAEKIIHLVIKCRPQTAPAQVQKLLPLLEAKPRLQLLRQQQWAEMFSLQDLLGGVCDSADPAVAKVVDRILVSRRMTFSEVLKGASLRREADLLIVLLKKCPVFSKAQIGLADLLDQRKTLASWFNPNMYLGDKEKAQKEEKKQATEAIEAHLQHLASTRHPGLKVLLQETMRQNKGEWLLDNLYDSCFDLQHVIHYFYSPAFFDTLVDPALKLSSKEQSRRRSWYLNLISEEEIGDHLSSEEAMQLLKALVTQESFFWIKNPENLHHAYGALSREDKEKFLEILKEKGKEHWVIRSVPQIETGKSSLGHLQEGQYFAFAKHLGSLALSSLTKPIGDLFVDEPLVEIGTTYSMQMEGHYYQLFKSKKQVSLKELDTLAQSFAERKSYDFHKKLSDSITSDHFRTLTYLLSHPQTRLKGNNSLKTAWGEWMQKRSLEEKRILRHCFMAHRAHQWLDDLD